MPESLQHHPECECHWCLRDRALDLIRRSTAPPPPSQVLLASLPDKYFPDEDLTSSLDLESLL